MPIKRAVENGTVFPPEALEILRRYKRTLNEIKAACEASRLKIEESYILLHDAERRMAGGALDRSEAAE